MRDALFDAEAVRLVALPPSVQLREGEEAADSEEEGGDLAAAAGGERVGGFGFRCRFNSVLILFKRLPRRWLEEWSWRVNAVQAQVRSKRESHLRKASNVLSPSVKVFFSPNALSSS